MELCRRIDESFFEYKWRLCKAKRDKEIDLDWDEIADLLGGDVSGDHLRKTSYGYEEMYEYMIEKYGTAAEAGAADSVINDITLARHELKKERQKLSDERTALNATLRNQARNEADLEYLREMISQAAESAMPFVPSEVKYDGDNDLIICLSDLHIGLAASNNFGEYNSAIAYERANKYLDRIMEIQRTHFAQNAHVILMGDLINGDIHTTTRLQNREMVTRQVMIAAELISHFVYELSKTFHKVYVNGVSGNHSRMGFKDEVLRGDRLDNLIPWYMKAKLEHIENVEFVDGMNYDPTIGEIVVRGKEYIICHGDFDSFSKSGVSKLSMMLGHIPDGIFYGHLHTCSVDEVADVKIIRSGSFCGAVDDYAVSKRLRGAPSQMVCVANSSGILSYYPVKLN